LNQSNVEVNNDEYFADVGGISSSSDDSFELNYLSHNHTQEKEEQNHDCLLNNPTEGIDSKSCCMI
jgi:hypothetical protein